MIERLLPPDCAVEDRDGAPVPVSRRFDDVYFSAGGGLEETRLVFLEGNGLGERMAGRRHFTVAETGFGTGMNFLATLQLLEELGNAAPRLNYIATEIAPLDAAAIRAALGHLSLPHRGELLDLLPPRWPGRHRRLLAGGRVTLDLLYGDSAMRLGECAFEADAWFLDGFAPARNPDMWSDTLFRLIAGRSAPGATLASFTAAGEVRRGLEEAGFSIERHRGYGGKRHRITGRLKRDPATGPDRGWEPPGRVAVVGAGIAGASVAHALRRQGLEPLVVTGGDGPADGASGNIAAVQTPRLTALDSPAGRLSLAAWGFARYLAEAAGASTATGSVLYAHDEREALRQAKILAQGWPGELIQAVDADGAKLATGVDMGLGGCFYPQGGAVAPRRLIDFLLDGCEVETGVAVDAIRRDGGGVGIIHKDGTIGCDAVVIAAGAGLARLDQPWLPRGRLQVTSGHVSHLPSGALKDTPGTGMSFGGYLAPAADGRVALGASFDRHDPAAPLPGSTRMEHERNLGLLPDAARAAMPPADAIPDGRVSLRLAAPDRQPLAGRLDRGVYALAGLGARGMVTGPLLGEWVAGLILGRPSPLDTGMEAVVAAGRLDQP